MLRSHPPHISFTVDFPTHTLDRIEMAKEFPFAKKGEECFWAVDPCSNPGDRRLASSLSFVPVPVLACVNGR